MTSGTRQRTYDRETWLRSRDAWDAGRYGVEWSDWRNIAAKAGLIFPPDGSPDDSWSDARPSQRAMVVRAIRETPRLLRWALSRPGVGSWGDVVGHLLTGRDELAIDADRREHDWSEVKRGDRPVPIGAVVAIVADSIAQYHDEEAPR